MAEINTGDGGEAKKGKPKRQQLRVDFTPMVDMNLLLITFFMFCTTLSKPQIMNLVVPSRDDKEILSEKPKTADSRTTTVILAEDNIVYYYFGKPNYEDYTSLHQTDHSPTGLRAVLVEKNGDVIRQVAELRLQRQREEISEDIFQERLKVLKDADGLGQVVIIKPTPGSTYENLVDVLDEMQICSIGTYAIVELSEGDLFLIDNFRQNGALSNQMARSGR